jgi:1-deoxyxylulose-5-phosphate synthase
MEYTRLGSSGLKVSRIALGTMSFGDGSGGREAWAIGYDAAAPFFRQAVDLGTTFWDTANIYSFGTSEEVVGQAVKEFTRRDDVVLATKLFNAMHDGPGGSGLLRKAIMEQIDASLTRLGTDYIDLYQIHRFDPETPVEETMEALDDVVKAGKARYTGASSMWAWQFAKLQHAAEANGWTRCVSMQDQYTCSTARRSARCSLCSPTKASAASPGARWQAVSPHDPGATRAQTGPRAARTRISKAGRCGSTATRRSSTRSSASRRAAECRWPRSRWPGCPTCSASRPGSKREREDRS